MIRPRLVVLVLVLSLLALPAPAQTPGELRLNDARHRLVIRVEPKDAGFVLWDGDGTPLGALAIEGDRVRLRDAAGALQWTVKRKDFGPQIDDAAGERLYRLRKRTDEWRLEDAAKMIVARIRVREGEAAEIRDVRGATMLTVKRADPEGFVFTTEAGARVAEVAGAQRVAAGLWFGVERFSPAERAALWAYFASLDR
ncbi:MAG: hypothetical protein E6K82_15320 [Candidatus Rokuibacteriota bacterium]|nr:MAG: hypothetical protein E6K82_15320 [Candidatus Rokubacteria bacterium]